ncbi:hypothetical protein ACT6P6_24040 [Priestia endophytica]
MVNTMIITAVAIFAKEKAQLVTCQTNEECAESTASYSLWSKVSVIVKSMWSSLRLGSLHVVGYFAFLLQCRERQASSWSSMSFALDCFV